MISIFTSIKNQLITFFKGMKLGFIGLQAYYYYPGLMVFPFAYGVSVALLFIALVMSIIMSAITMILPTIFFLATIILSIFTYILLNVAISNSTAAYCENSKLNFATSTRTSLIKFKYIILWLTIIYIGSILITQIPTSTIAPAIIFQTIWLLATFFIYPILTFEELSVFKSLQKSIRLVLNNLGAILGISFSLGILSYFLIEAAVAIAPHGILFMYFLAKNYSSPHMYSLQFLASIIGVACFLLIFFGAVAYVYMGETIVSVIIYRHINNQPTGIFNYQQLETIIQEPKAKNPLENEP